MSDVIQLLPEAIANQIAAGEVIQRPASVVKELLENALDAGADQIRLLIKDGGRQLIQVIDNGVGMSEMDARLAFERHATSKLRSADDLWAIRTMGFRGEALASIAAVAQVELCTRRQPDELGTRIVIEGSELISQEPDSCPAGTNLAVKNLFYNVPARRNFLKSTSVEMRHIVDEFQRLAIAHEQVHFSLYHNDKEVLHLPPANLRQRLVNLFGKAFNKRLVPVHQETDYVELTGFVGKPDFAKKSRGDQYFFVNNRFIKSGYLHHALMNAYEDLLPKDTYPFYVIFIEIDPARIDVNVHPTKQEIKFEDERIIYNYVRVAVRHALGQHHIVPTLDFDQPTFVQPGRTPTPNAPRRMTTLPSRANLPSPGQTDPGEAAEASRQADNLKNWQALYQGMMSDSPTSEDAGSLILQSKATGELLPDNTPARTQIQRQPYQIHSSYIISHIKSGFLLIDQQAAHERILYEGYLKALRDQQAVSQSKLFPRTLELGAAESALLTDLLPDLQQLGFDVQPFGQNTFVINGVPAELAGRHDEIRLIEQLIERYRRQLDLDLEATDRLARSLARGAALSRGQHLTVPEMQQLIDQLFACEMPYKSPSGRACFITYELNDIAKQFEI